MQNLRNTKRKGRFTLFVYPEKPNYFIGVCLEFDVIKEGKNPKDALNSIKEASIGYLETIIKNNYSDDLLNSPAPKQYWKKYHQYLKAKADAIKKLEGKIDSKRKEKSKESKKPNIRWEEYVKNTNIKVSKDENVPYPEALTDEEKKDRLLGFFQLLYEIDRHNHPELYETQHKENV